MFNIDKLMEALQQNLKYSDMSKMSDPAYVQNYLQDIFTRTMPMMNGNKSGSTNTENKASDPQVIELHDYLIIRTDIPEQYDERNIRISLMGNQVIIKYEPGDLKKTVLLAKPIIKDGITAVIKNHILEVKLPIDSEANMDEIEVKYI